MRRRHLELELDAAHALEDPLQRDPLAGEQVAEHAERRQHHRCVEQHRAEDQRLHVAAAVARQPEVREAAPHDRRDEPDQDRRGHEHPQRLVHRVDPEDRDAVAADVGPHRREQPRLAQLLVRADRDVVDRDGHLARLDDRLERVGELRDDLHRQRRLAVVGAEAGGRVGHRGLGGLAHDPGAEPLQRLLGWREVLDRHHLAVADDHVGAAGEDRTDQLDHVGAVVLVVGVGVDDHVGAELQGGVQAGLEAGGQPLVVRQPDDVVDAVLARDLDRAVGGAVVDDQPLDGVEAGDLAGEVAQGDGEGLLLVQARDLDDQLHQAGIRRYRVDTLAPAMGRADRFAKAAFALLCIGSLVGFLVYPTYPNYDSYYSLLWGREVLDLQAPTFEGFRVPTEHPLAIVAGAALSLLGDLGDRVWIALIIASYLWLIAAVYRLGKIAFTPLIGMVAAALLLTRFDYAFLTARGYIDIPYMAMVVWAATLEAERARRGVPVLVLLALAGLLRPEAWVLAAFYWCWLAWPASWRERALYAVLAAAGPVLWAATDFAVTGDPLFSLHYTSSSAEELGRNLPLSQLPSAMPEFFANLVKLPVLVAAALGLVVAVVAVPRRAAAPLALLTAGIVTFVLIGIAGASAIERYLAIAAVALLVFAAVSFGGFTLLERGALRTGWMV